MVTFSGPLGLRQLLLPKVTENLYSETPQKPHHSKIKISNIRLEKDFFCISTEKLFRVSFGFPNEDFFNCLRSNFSCKVDMSITEMRVILKFYFLNARNEMGRHAKNFMRFTNKMFSKHD